MKRIPPLAGNQKIVDERGQPTPAFLLLINELLKGGVVEAAANAAEALTTANNAQDDVDALEDNTIVAGVGLAGGGTLATPMITLDLEDTAVTPDTYGAANKVPVITVDQQGRIIDAEEVDASGLPPGGATGQVLGKLSDTDFDVDWIDQSGGGGGGGGGAPTSAKFWRVRNLRKYPGADLGICELELLDGGGTNLVGTGTPLSSSDYDATYTAAKAFDGIITGDNGWYARNDANINEWLGYEFTSAATVASARIYPYSPQPTDGPLDFAVENSANGKFWQLVGLYLAETWVANTPQEFEMPAGPAPTTPTLRGPIEGGYYNDNHIDIVWPAGTVEGDTVLVINANGYFVSTPSGWTEMLNASSGVNRVVVASKVMSAGDIAAGGVTFNASGSFDGAWMAATFVGYRTLTSFNNFPGGNANLTVNTDGTPLTTDLAIYYASCRHGSPHAITIDQGTYDVQVANAGYSITASQGNPPAPGVLSAYMDFISGTDGSAGVIVIAH